MSSKQNKKYFIPGIEKAPYVPLELEAPSLDPFSIHEWHDASSISKSKIKEAFAMVEKSDLIKDAMTDSLKEVMKNAAEKMMAEAVGRVFDPSAAPKGWPETGPGLPPKKTELQEQMEDWFP